MWRRLAITRTIFKSRRHWHQTIKIGASTDAHVVTEQLPLHASLYRTDRLHCISFLSGIPVGSKPMAAVATWTSWAPFPWKHRRHAQGLRVAALGEA